MKIVISSGHGKYVRGASGYLDEVDEARLVVEAVADYLRQLGDTVTTFHDDVSQSQNENLNRIVDFHNSKTRDLDISVHFNAYQTTSKPMGTEVLYTSSSGHEWATKVVNSICDEVGFINRGAKERTDLFFLNNTEATAILIETCFVDSKADADLYKAEFDDVCKSIASAISGTDQPDLPPPVDPELPYEEDVITSMANASLIAKYNWKDRGVAPRGYIKGFALAWAQVVMRYDQNDPIVKDMAKGMGSPDQDALAWYEAEFKQIGACNEVAGWNTLRHLFVLLMGLGMRESSGKHCEGRDMSADNVTSDTAEAGLYQTSYNAHNATPLFDDLMEEYENGDAQGFKGYVDDFADGVTCSQSDWQCYGSGKGFDFQELCKNAPAFAVESCALTLRNLRQHYGPINRKEAELREEADWLLLDIQRYVLGVQEVV